MLHERIYLHCDDSLIVSHRYHPIYITMGYERQSSAIDGHASRKVRSKIHTFLQERDDILGALGKDKSSMKKDKVEVWIGR